VGFLFLLVRFL